MKSTDRSVSVRRLRAPLLRWYDEHARDLPWRRSRDPYAIWISEAMLQQTRVETVIPYWQRFLERFPTVESLAQASLDEIYAIWTGLGYYSRARNLKAAAETIVADHGGALPETAEELRTLRGIGRYTAGAVASIAFDREEPLVDGNVIRVLTRWIGIREDSGSKEVVEWLWGLAGGLVRGPRPGDLNQALMELGATVCTPRAPRCPVCPIRRACDARARGDAEALPRKRPRARQTPLRAVAAWIERGGKVLAVRRPERGLMAGLWELPGGEIAGDEEGKDRLSDLLEARVGLRIRDPESLGSIEHVFTHRRLRLEVFRGRAGAGERVRLEGFDAHRWVRPSRFLELAHAGSTRKALTLLGVTEESSARAAGRAPR
jgi:A/G-specific adenine glycosylase